MVVALICLSLIVAKPIDDVERKCIVKYLSDKELLDSSFVVDPVNSDNCDELISAKIFEIYFDMIYDGKKPEEDHLYYVEHMLRTNGVADVVLKSLLYHEDSKEAKDLKETVNQMKTIADIFQLWNSLKIVQSSKNLQIKSPDSATELCLKHYVTAEVYTKSFYSNDFEESDKYDIKGLECDKLITAFHTNLEVHLLETLPKLKTDREQNCMKMAYVNSNMTKKFSDIFIFTTIPVIFDDGYITLYNKYGHQIQTFYEMIMECMRLGFISEHAPEVRNVYSIDFTREGHMFTPQYDENYGIIVKFNTDRSLNEVVIIANQTSRAMNNSQCLLEGFKDQELGKMSLKMMAAEDNYEVDRIVQMKELMSEIFITIKESCEFKNYFTAMFDDKFNEIRKNEEEISETMNCFQEFVTEEKVNGITYYRVNIYSQRIDRKCEVVLYLLERMKTPHWMTAPQDICMRRELKKLNMLKQKFLVEVLAELEISPEQKAKERIKFNDLIIKISELLFKCPREAFDLI